MGKRGFLSMLLGIGGGDSPKTKTPLSPIRAASHPIHFDGTLVDKLKNDHTELFRLYHELRTVSEHGDFSALPDLLASFRLALQTHLMVENVKFYAYLQQNFANDADLMTYIVNIKKEMDVIARAVVKFTNTYASQRLTSEKAAAFGKELDQIGGTLVKRVGLEETRLYTLYMPSY
ncbi:MAG: hemerythrin domain-containing protein [Burkholderiales bacterium]|jgi:regulator of sigma D|nr:hemerythrin domain-containing protein [Burkholderiales bacterium]